MVAQDVPSSYARLHLLPELRPIQERGGMRRDLREMRDRPSRDLPHALVLRVPARPIDAGVVQLCLKSQRTMVEVFIRNHHSRALRHHVFGRSC